MRPIPSLSLIAAAVLAGCNGNDLDHPTYSGRSKEFRIPPLKAGDRWVVEESGSGYAGAVSAVEVRNADTLHGAVPAYAAAIQATIAAYATGRGDSVFQFVQTGLFLMRKSDQEVIFDSAEVTSQVRFAGDTGLTQYRLVSVTRSEPQETVPTVLRPGLAWTVATAKSRKSTYWLDGVESGKLDTSWTEIRQYAAGAVADLKVKAGTFYAIEVTWVRDETQEMSRGWFSEAARTYVMETKSQAGRETGRYELTALTLK